MRASSFVGGSLALCFVVVCTAGALASHLSVTTSYDSAAAMRGWLYGKAVLCNVTEIEDWTCAPCSSNPGMTKVRVFRNETTGGRALVGFNTVTNSIVVIFRGSVDIQNWINNLDFVFVGYPNPACASFSGEACNVHKGFLNVYTSISEPLLAYVATLVSQEAASHPKLFIGGHSLGGALAILAAVDITLQHKAVVPTIAVYTFGEPRVGNPAWAKWVSEDVIVGGKQYRVTHEADPVPRLPPLEFGFLHVPHEVWYNNDDAGNNYTVCVDNATAEDYTNCENTQYAFDIQDHTLYLGIPSGCASP